MIPVTSGSKTLKDALNEAMRDWVSNIEDTFYIIGTGGRPQPVSAHGARFQRGGRHASRAPRCWREYQRLPDAIVACVGGGRNAIGMFHPFLNDHEVVLWSARKRPATASKPDAIPPRCRPVARACCTATAPT